jgi:hypothetical protein
MRNCGLYKQKNRETEKCPTSKLDISLFLCCSVLLFSQTMFAQQLPVQKVNNASLSYVLNNIRSTHKAETADIFVTVYSVSNKSGSAKQPETHEVTDNIYIAVSEFDEQPKQSLFVIKNLYAPGGFVLTKQPDQTIKLSFSYIEGKQRKKVEAIVKIDAVQAGKTEE